jgi:hypothetical protein
MFGIARLNNFSTTEPPCSGQPAAYLKYDSVEPMRHLSTRRTVFGGSLLAMALIIAVTSAATAQTLTDPYPRSHSPRPVAGKPTASKHMKACPEYGAGFYRVDGTDACVKIGGFVDIGVSSR